MSSLQRVSSLVAAASVVAIAAAAFSRPLAAVAMAGLLAAGLFLWRALRRSRSLPLAPVEPPGNGLSMARPAQSNTSPHEDSGEIFAAMINGLGEGVLVIDESARVIAANEAAQEIFAGAPRPFEFRRLSEVTRRPAIHSAFADALEGKTPAEVKIELPEPGRRIYSLRVVPLQARSPDQRARAIGIFFDITKLERLERVRQEFFSNVSHELRTPLTAILAYVETLEDGAIDDPVSNRQFLSVIRRNAERMHNLMDDILELSAIEAGTIAIEAASVSLSTIAEDVFAAIKSRARERNVELRNEVPAEARVHADARRLEQMITNLVDNAIKFNRDGGSVTLAHKRGERDRIIVRDTGEGIPPEHLPRLFERFYRVDRARSRELGGTGLGLAIVKHLARAHGGDVRVDSVPGRGSTFVIELPVKAEGEAS